MFPSGDDPLPPFPTWDLFELGNILRWNKPLQNLGNKLKMENNETKSTNICKFSVGLTILNATKYIFFCLRVTMRWKLIHYFSNSGTFGNLGTFGNVMNHAPLFELF